MPELPEVETVRLGLARLLPGRVILRVENDTAKSFPNDKELVHSHLIGATVSRVDRRGKALIIELDTGFSLLVHLKMTGQLVFREPEGESFGAGHPNDSLIGKLPDRSTRVIMDFTDGSRLFFNDQRKFGWVKFMRTQEIPEEPFIAKLGPEALSENFTFEEFRSRLQRRSRTSIKAAILDQTVLAGVGNIYADEGLFAARIHPATPVEKVSAVKLKRLYAALRDVMQLSISLGGSSDKNYVDAEGRKGSYLTFAKVFRREGQPCVNCGRTVEKIRVAGRGTHICAHCQPRVRR
jgi:formamidopyrimidine-DNA glycosylase